MSPAVLSTAGGFSQEGAFRRSISAILDEDVVREIVFAERSWFGPRGPLALVENF